MLKNDSICEQNIVNLRVRYSLTGIGFWVYYCIIFVRLKYEPIINRFVVCFKHNLSTDFIF